MARAGRQAIHLVAVTTLGIFAAAISPTAQAATAPGRAAVVKSPNPSSTDNELNGVSADSATDAWAVGFYDDSTGVRRPLIAHWDGAAWSQVTSPTPPRFFTLSAVSAVSPTDVWAVGTCTCLGTETEQTLILHWDGTAWSQV
jgi:hypothetical protein